MEPPMDLLISKLIAPCRLTWCISACTFQFVGPVFLYFFQNFPNFCFRG